MVVENAQIAITAARALIACGTVAGCKIVVQNMGSNDIYIGGPTVTAENGLELLKGENVTLDIGPCEAIYGICKAGETSTACFIRSQAPCA
jgi:hypothetical protein